MKDSPLYPILYMVVLSAVFGAAVSAVAVATRDRVEAGRLARFRAHVMGAFGVVAPDDPLALDALWVRTVERRESPAGTAYIRRDGEEIRGIAFPFRGPGFWGPISGVVAVDPATRRIQGIAFTRHQETPGLGGRITEPWFREQFRGKNLEPRADQTILDFVFRTPTGPREVEAITGATQTSMRLARFLNSFLAELPDRPVLTEGGGG